MSYQCLRTDGNGYARIADAPEQGLNMGLSDFMIEMRVKAGITGFLQMIAAKRESSGLYVGWSVYIHTTGELRFAIDDGPNGAEAKSNEIIGDLRWHTLIFVADRSSATGIKIFIGGTEATYALQDDPTSVGSIDNTQPFHVGSWGAGGALLPTGLIDEVRIWNFGYGGLPADYEAYITWRAAGRNVFLDIGQYNGGAWNGYADAYREEKVVDGGLENWTTDTPDDWDELNESGGVRDITKESTEKHGGSFAVKLEATNNDGTNFYIGQDITLTANKYYEVSRWIYFPTRTIGRARSRIKNDTDGDMAVVNISATNAEYTNYPAVFKPSIANNNIIVQLISETTTGIVYFDDISVKRVGLVAHYKFDGTYDDETTNANHLTAGGTGNVFPGYTLKKTKIISPFWIK